MTHVIDIVPGDDGGWVFEVADNPVGAVLKPNKTLEAQIRELMVLGATRVTVIRTERGKFKVEIVSKQGGRWMKSHLGLECLHSGLEKELKASMQALEVALEERDGLRAENDRLCALIDAQSETERRKGG